MAKRMLFVERNGGLLDVAAPKLRPARDCIGALARFRDAGFELAVLVDPSERGSAADEAELDRFLTGLLESQGLAIGAWLRCEHGSADCDCALPGLGLVSDYLAGDALDRERSLVVGARAESAALARNMGLPAYRLGGDLGWTEVAHEALDRPRRSSVTRRTRETDIAVTVDLDREAEPEVATGIGFFDHMLEQLGKHGGFALTIECRGDLEVDEHHTVEDVALALGRALNEALGDKRGIGRYGFLLPMDEAEAKVAIDLSGRAYCVFETDFPREQVGGLPTELVGHFFRSLSDTLGAAVHVEVHGENTHHMIEACFKGVARALRQAFERSGADLPSTKGAL